MRLSKEDIVREYEISIEASGLIFGRIIDTEEFDEEKILLLKSDGFIRCDAGFFNLNPIKWEKYKKDFTSFVNINGKWHIDSYTDGKITYDNKDFRKLNELLNIERNKNA